MDFEKVKAVLRSYDAHLKELGHEAARCEKPSAPDTRSQLSHARWMCQEVLSNSEFSEGKAKRWLGFVQGVLWSTGVRTVEQMKDDNRPR